MSDPFGDWGKQLYLALMDPRVFAAAIPDIEQTIRTSIEDNFRMGGRWGNDNPFGGGSNPWAPVKHPDSSKRILVDTADLMNSIDVRVELVDGQILITVSARPFYARFLQEGTIYMEPRPFLVIQNEDIEQIIDILRDTMFQ